MKFNLILDALILRVHLDHELDLVGSVEIGARSALRRLLIWRHILSLERESLADVIILILSGACRKSSRKLSALSALSRLTAYVVARAAHVKAVLARVTSSLPLLAHALTQVHVLRS